MGIDYRNIRKSIATWSLIIILIFSMLQIISFKNGHIKEASAISTWIQNSETDFKNGTCKNISIVGIGENAELRIDLSDTKIWNQENLSKKTKC